MKDTTDRLNQLKAELEQIISEETNNIHECFEEIVKSHFNVVKASKLLNKRVEVNLVNYVNDLLNTRHVVLKDE